MPRSASYRATFCRPVSTTAVTPGTVTDVSAMFVARMTRRRPPGAGRSARSCSSASSDPWSGSTSTSPPTRPATAAIARRISPAPGRKPRTLPGVRAMTPAIAPSIGVPGS